MPQNYSVGHDMHVIHAKRLGQTPWGWRPGTVGWVDGQTASIEYLLEEGSVEIWHHEPLDMLSVGTPVRIHEGYHALDIAGQWLNVPRPPAWEMSRRRLIATYGGRSRTARWSQTSPPVGGSLPIRCLANTNSIAIG